MYYKKPEERTTHEQQLVEMVNRQVRHKWVRTKWDKKLTKKRGIEKEVRGPQPPTRKLFAQALPSSGFCHHRSFGPACPYFYSRKKETGNFSRIPISSQAARSENQGDRTWDHRSSSCLGQLDHFSREPPLHPGHRKPSLAEAFRQGIRRKRQRFRFLGRRTVPSGIAWIGWPPHSSKGAGNSKIFTVRSCLVTPMVRPPAASPRRKKSKRSRKPSSLALPASTAFRRTNPGCHARRFR